MRGMTNAFRIDGEAQPVSIDNEVRVYDKQAIMAAWNGSIVYRCRGAVK